VLGPYAAAVTRDTRWALGSIAAGLVVAGALLALSLNLVTFSQQPPSDSALIAIPTSELEPGMLCHLALLEAELIAHPDWGVAVEEPGGTATLVFWPRGYVGSARADHVEVLNADGDVVARTGDRITAGGGMAVIDGLEGFMMCPEGPTVIDPVQP
jgi:hypothetical protein